MELKAKSRTLLGRKVKALRRAGFLPAVIYGEKVESRPIAVPYKDFEKVWHEAGESTILTLDVEGEKFNVLIHDIVSDPIRGILLHADFYAVRMDKVIRAKIPVEFFGESPAVKNEGGILVKVIQEIEVEALPQNLPHELRIDLSALTSIGSRLIIKDVSVSSGVKILADENDIVALVEAPRTEEEIKALDEKEAQAPLEVKTEREVNMEAKAKAETEEKEA
jgi:large subunit ribosomal protein L25